MTAASPYAANLMARLPPGSVRVFGDCPRKSNNMRGHMSGASDESAPAGVGDNSKIRKEAWYTPSKQTFDEAATANAGPGRNLHRLRVLQSAIFDSRLGACPLPLKLLSAVMDYGNRESGTAHPGARTLAEDIYLDLQKLPPEERAEALDKAASALMNAFTLLKQFGYDVTKRRAPTEGAHAVAHHALTNPDREEMLAAIEIHQCWQEQETARKADSKKKPSPNGGREVSSPHASNDVSPPHGAREVTDLMGRVRSEGADLMGRGGADLTRRQQISDPHSITEPKNLNLPGPDAPNGGVAGATSPEANPRVEPRSKSKRATTPARSAVAAAAVAAYNEAAERHGFARCEVLTNARADRLDKRLVDIGGIEAFRLALTAIPRDKFLMGRVPGRNGSDPFKLTIDRLLQTDGGLGDVLAKLLDAASSSPSRPTNDEEAELAAIYAQMRKEDGLT